MLSKYFTLLFFNLLFCIGSFGQSNIGTKKYLGKEFQFPSLRTLGNTLISIDDLKGKPTLVNFWFTSCPPCIAEIPMLNELRRRFADSVNFVAVTFESKAKVEKFLQAHPFDFIQVVDATRYIKELGVRSYPLNIFVDKNGIVKEFKVGAPSSNDGDNENMARVARDFESILGRLLAE